MPGPDGLLSPGNISDVVGIERAWPWPQITTCFCRRSGPFNVAVRELLAQYMALEEFYMNETCSMAIRIDEV